MLVLLFVGPSFPQPLRADWINLTGAETARNIAEITVLDDRVRVAIEIYIGDLAKFEDLLPDEFLAHPRPDRPALAKRLQRFSTNIFRVEADNGAPLPVELKTIEPRTRKKRASPFAGKIDPFTRRRLPSAPRDKRVLYAELEYSFQGKPATLTFVPPRDAKGIATVTIGFIAYHKAVPVIDFRYLSRPAKLKLDWGDPWYTKFDNPNLKRHHKSALMSFLYVEPREVRHEVLIRVRDMQKWTDLSLNGRKVIGAEEKAALKDRASAFLAARNPLKVDGVLVKPASARSDFVKISLTGLQVLEDTVPLDLSTAILGVILSYPVKHLPKNVSIKWELFNERIGQIPTTAIDPAGPLKGFVSPSDPMIEWQNYLRKYKDPKVLPVRIDDGRSIGLPVMSLVLLVFAIVLAVLAVRPPRLGRRWWAAASLLGVIAAALLVRVSVVDVRNPFAGPPDKKITAQIVMAILNNVADALVEKEQTALRQALQVVVADDMIADVELELRRALAIKVTGGGIARIDAIENLVLQEIVALKDNSGLRTLAQWTVRASAGHWGHAHRRKVRFRALVEMDQFAGVWKLTGLTVVDARRETK